MKKLLVQRIELLQSYRFILVGILNTVIGYSAFFVFLNLAHLNYTISLIISHIVGVINSYLWNKNFTFRISGHSNRMLFKFIIVYLVTFAINYSLLTLFVEVLNYNELVSQAVSLFMTTLISFFGQRYWSFKNNEVGV